MSDRKEPAALPNPAEAWTALAGFTTRAQKICLDFVTQQSKSDNFQIPDPAVVTKAFVDLGLRMWSDPTQMMQAQFGLWRDQMALWQNAAQRLSGVEVAPVATPAKDDKRFSDEAWNTELAFDFLKQSYLLTARCIQDTVRNVEGLDEQTKLKAEFYTRQFVDALSPSNYAMTNPAVLRATMESGGQNLLKGLDHLLTDLERGRGKLAISMTDYDAFELGKNVATTPGKVVYQNDLMQLLQYSPTTEQVHQRPLLIVPPWINKFYILDLRPKNSLIKWAVDQGFTVFVVSWVNPDERLAHKDFGDYMLEGPLAALDAIEQATGERQVNIIGYCIGGTLTACTLAYMAAKGDDRITSATFLTTMTDFRECGELRVFIDEAQLDLLDKHMQKTGYLEGRHMSQVFNMMRDNDLIWSFVVNNYLLGKEPFPFDLLYWNSDNTRMPMMMHSFYLRRMYEENRLVQPGGIILKGVPIDLRAVKIPVYMLSTKDDHIAPWTSTYAGTQNFSGPIKFVLSASGHIAGVVNPPVANKYCYWTNSKLPASPEEWFNGAKQTPGSWWPDWQKWAVKQSGPKIPARIPGDGKLPTIEDAPGSYVKVQVVE